MVLLLVGLNFIGVMVVVDCVIDFLGLVILVVGKVDGGVIFVECVVEGVCKNRVDVIF